MFTLTFLEAMELVFRGWFVVGEDFAPMTYLRRSCDGIVEVSGGGGRYPLMVTHGTLDQKYAVAYNMQDVKNLTGG